MARSFLCHDAVKTSAFVTSAAVAIAAAAAAAAASTSYLSAKLAQMRLRRARQTWNSDENRGVVILHQLPRPKTCASVNPFAVKVETFLRAAGIKYINDFEFPHSPETKKSPWITLDGQDVADSQIIMETLAKKFSVDMGSALSPKERAVSRSLRVLLEDHLYWVFVIDRYVNQEAKYLKDLSPSGGCRVGLFTEFIFELRRRRAVVAVTNQAYHQGLLRIGKANIQKSGIEDLESISTILGSKTYVMGGEKPTELDFVVFAFVACFVFTSHEGSIYKTLIEKRLTNLHQHMNRMKVKYYPDWNNLAI